MYRGFEDTTTSASTQADWQSLVYTTNISVFFHLLKRRSQADLLTTQSIALHTPFTGLCVFSAALLNSYAVAFPNFLPDVPEEPSRRQLCAENLSDLEKIAKLWKLGEEWVQVIRTAETLYERVKTNRATSSAREDYHELESSCHYAPIGGLYGDKLQDSPRNSGSISICGMYRRATRDIMLWY